MEGSCQKLIIYVRNLLNAHIPWSIIYPFILMISLLPVVYVRYPSGSHVSRSSIYMHILGSTCLHVMFVRKLSNRGRYLKVTSYLHTPRCRVLVEKLTDLQLVKKFPAFHGTERFITAPTSVHHLSLSWASPIESTYPHPTCWRSILMFQPSMLSSSQWSLSLQFPNQDPIYPPLLTHTCHMPSPSHLSRFYHPHSIVY